MEAASTSLSLSKPQKATTVDIEVLKILPKGSIVTEVERGRGTSSWTQRKKLTVKHPDGQTKNYFLKTCSENVAAVMMKGEYISLSTIYELFPDNSPKPFGWGEFQSAPGTFFVLMDFLELDDDCQPGPAQLAQFITALHRKGVSPSGKFGFHVPNCHGKKVQPHYWDESWCRYFTNLITEFFDEDIRINGSYPELEQGFAILREHVIPRLLEPLQADGRVLTPSLVHGDPWHENIGTSAVTGEVMVYDPAVWYAHHEYEFGMWRCAFAKFDETNIAECLKLMPADQPEEECDDRIRLYGLKFYFSHSFHWLEQTAETRERIMEDIGYLNTKYAPEKVMEVLGPDAVDKASRL